jgi:hypothetical protein
MPWIIQAATRIHAKSKHNARDQLGLPIASNELLRRRT